jgi:AraC-like DNA-binding protein
VDVLSDLLSRARARGAVFAHSTLHPPWGLALGDDAPLAVHAVIRGEVWLRTPGGELRLSAGDVALVPRTRDRTGHAIAHAPGAPTVPLAGALAAMAVPGRPRRFVNAGEGGATEVMCGAYAFDGDLCDTLLSALPPAAVVRAGDGGPGLRATLNLLADELAGDGPGHQTVLDRLLDLLLVHALRAHLADPAAARPGWHRALDDPPVAAALARLHDDPARAWTVASLAAEAGLSRAAFARRFAAAVGEPPLAYLTRWRMRLAEELLRRPGTTLAGVALAVGYASEFAFSAAFKRERGLAPAAWRRAARAEQAAA